MPEVPPLRKHSNSFPKSKRITGKKRLDALFSSGESFIAYPLRVVFLKREKSINTEVAVVVSVSKRNFKRAVKRNRVKRLIRENFRQMQLEFDLFLASQSYSLDVAFLYLKDELPDFNEIQKAMNKTVLLLKSKCLEQL